MTAAPEPVPLTRAGFAAATAGVDPAVRRALAALLLLRSGSLRLTIDGEGCFAVTGPEPGPTAEIRIRDKRLIRRVLKAGELGVAEGYIAREWESPDPTAFLELFARNNAIIDEELTARPALRVLLRVQHWLRRNTRRQAARNIAAHYDLGNDFYQAWLDRSMTYSSALFRQAEDLESAQIEKYRSLARASDLRPGHHVLEIGCGWGGFAEFAAKELGCRVTALTISPAQHAYAARRIAEASLAEKVEVALRDYRDERGTYDRIASIEMFEAVGEKYWPLFFDRLRACLAPGGLAGLQVITIQDRFFRAYKRQPDFIQRHVFPGGMLPTPAHLDRLIRNAGFSLTSEKIFGHDYARTLAEWRRRFLDAWPKLGPMGFDERFKRLWEYYLTYCEAGFRSGNIDVRQIIVVKGI